MSRTLFCKMRDFSSLIGSGTAVAVTRLDGFIFMTHLCKFPGSLLVPSCHADDQHDPSPKPGELHHLPVHVKCRQLEEGSHQGDGNQRAGGQEIAIVIIGCLQWVTHGILPIQIVRDCVRVYGRSERVNNSFAALWWVDDFPRHFCISGVHLLRHYLH